MNIIYKIKDYVEKFLQFLTKYHVTANRIENFRLILGIIAIIGFESFRFFSFGYNLIFVAFLLNIVVVALARYQHTASDRSKFLNLLVNYLLYAFLLAYVEVVSGSYNKMVYHLFIIPVLYLLSVIKKNEFATSDWIIKPNPQATYLSGLIFLVVYSHWYLGYGLRYLTLSLTITNYVATFLSIYYLVYIQLRWKKMNLE